MKTIEDYLPLVTKLAADRAKKSSTDFDDLFQEGCVALIKAFKRVDETKAKGITFLYYRIFYAMFDLAYPGRRTGREPLIYMSDQAPVVDHGEFDLVDSIDEVVFLEGRLGEVQRRVVRMRSRGKKFHEIGTKLGFSKQRAQSIYEESLTLLRHSGNRLCQTTT